MVKVKERYYMLDGWSIVVLELDHINKKAEIRGYDTESDKVKECDYFLGLKLLLDANYNWKLMEVNK